MRLVRPAALLMFADILLLFSLLKGPHFVLLGIFFLGPVSAGALVSLLILSAGLFCLMLIRKSRKTYSFAQYFSLFLILNSLANLVLSLFIGSDMAGYLGRSAGTSSLAGFLLVQSALLLANFALFFALRRARPALS